MSNITQIEKLILSDINLNKNDILVRKPNFSYEQESETAIEVIRRMMKSGICINNIVNITKSVYKKVEK